MNKNELYHYGVKGMKWGVRRHQNPDGSLTPAGKKHVSRKYKKLSEKTTKALSKRYISMYVNAYNKAADDMNNGGIDKFNAAQRKKYGEKFAERKGYEDAYLKVFRERLNKYMSSSLSEFYKNDKNYKKGAKLVKKYEMLEWDELARNDNKKINELK